MFQRLLLFLLFALGSVSLPGQTITVTQPASFSSGQQDMFGAGFNLNYEQSIFHAPWNSSFGPSGGIADPGYGLGEYGFEISGGTYGHIGANFYSRDWSTGSVDVDFPVDVNLTYPANGSFERGEWITINTDYTVQNGAVLNSSFPQAGRIGLEFYFNMRFWLWPEICFYSCVTPGFDTGDFGDTLTIFEVAPSAATYACPTPPNFECTVPLLPASIPGNNYGLSGSFDLPNVVTTSNYNAGTQCLNASGSDQYATIGLEVFQFIGGLNIPYVSAVLGNLSGGDCFLGGQVCYDYVLFSAQFNVNLDNTQDLSFCPDVYTTLGFPTQLEYTVTDPISGVVVAGPAQANQVTMRVGDNLNIRYPCNYEFMSVAPVYNIQNSFTNHTYDEISFDLTMEALSAGITIQGFSTPGIYIPGFCAFGHPCNCSGTWPWEWSCDWCCDLYVPPTWFPPPITLGPWSFNIGPLYQNTIPLGTLPGIDWFDDTWELPGFTQQNGTPFILTPAVYSATVTNQQNVTCHDGNNGLIEVTLTNGTPPYTYHWSNGTQTTTAATTQTNNLFEAGIQYVLVEDANGCEVVANATITEPLFELSSLADNITSVDCNGNNTGSVTVNMNGGTPGYLYNWNPAVSSSATASNLTAGIYNLTVTDANGCLYNDQFILTEPTGLTATVSTTNVSCFNGNNGTAQVIPSGGTYPYTYNWSTAGTTSNVSGLAAGNYSVTVTDARACTFTVNFTITQPTAAIALSAAATEVSCKNGSDGAINLTVNGGSPGYTFQWTNSVPIQLSAVTEDLTGLPTGMYTVTTKDANGCTATLVQTVLEPANVLEGTLAATDVNCFGGNDGSINLNVTGGTSPYTFNWSNGSTAQNINNLVAGNYTVTVTDVRGCTWNGNITVDEPAALQGGINVTHVLCFGNSTGSLDLSVTGGNGNYTYNWSNGSTAQDQNNLPAGNYTVVVTDAKGCLLNQNAIITQPAAPLSATSVIDVVNCNGGNDGSIQLNAAGGTAAYSYQWNNSSSLVLADTDNFISSLPADAYTVDITDANGCHLLQTISVTQPAQPLAISASVVNNLCFNGTSGQIDITVTGGTTAYTFNWSNGSTNQDITAVASGNYTVNVTDANGCVDSSSFIISEPSTAVAASVNSLNVKCAGGSNGWALVNATGGVYPYTYQWSNGATTPNNTQLTAGVYTVVVTDDNGCTANTGVVITQPTNNLVVNHTATAVSCHGFSDGSILVNLTGGTTPYQVFFGDTTNAMMNTQNGYFVNTLIAGTYPVIAIDYNGCITNYSVTITEPDTITYNFVTTPVSCFAGSNGTVDLTVQGGTPAYSYVWSNGAITQDLLNITAGEYTVLISDANGCEVGGSVTVDQPLELITTSRVYPTTCIDENDGKIEIQVSGGISGYNYLWSNSEITQSIYELASGQYILNVTDMNGCIRTDTFFVNITDIECLSPPNAFTPDGDGYNDTWVLDKLDLYPNNVVKIFNKWGQLLYETKGTYIPWDGSYKGDILPAATYYYIIDLGNGTPAYTGHVTTVKSRD